MHLDLFDAIWKLYATAQKLRNPLAHWLWGVCDRVTDGLVAIDPREVHRIEAKKDVIHHAARRAKQAGPQPNEMLALGIIIEELNRARYGHVYVYREADFRSVIRAIKTAHDHTLSFIKLVIATRDDPEKAVQIYQQLIRAPEFRNLVEVPRQQSAARPPETPPQDAQKRPEE